jgi:hypothetical protein
VVRTIPWWRLCCGSVVAAVPWFRGCVVRAIPWWRLRCGSVVRAIPWWRLFRGGGSCLSKRRDWQTFHLLI